MQPAFPVRKPGGRIEQDVVAQREADPRSQRPEPWVGKFISRKRVLSARNLQVGLGAQHDLLELPVVAKLSPASQSVRGKWNIGEVAPLVPEIESAIGPPPPRACLGLWHGDEARRKVAGHGRAGR